jgi:mono/diheme cytochrome c family protein
VVHLNTPDKPIRWIRTTAVLTGLVGILPGSAGAEFDRGRALYENHCRQCHDSWAHKPGVRVVATYEGLRERVASWSLHSGLGWSANEITDVTEYLNRRFYQLGK